MNARPAWKMTGLALVQALLTSACGGGGDSNPAPAPVPPSSVVPTPIPPPPPAPPPVVDCQTRAPYTLCVTLVNPSVSATTIEHMKEDFFDVYPKLVARFNRAAPTSVDFVIGPAGYVAGASGNSVTYQARWLIDHPEDYDVVVHEVMHIVQSYTSSPGWITEGIADYVRYHYGVNNEAAGWHVQDPTPTSTYADGYGTTARFLIWVEQRYDVELVDALDAAARAGTYTPGIWISLTGRSVDDLWDDYVADPVLTP